MLFARPDYRFLFVIRRTPEAKLEQFEVIAKDSFQAFLALPDDLVDWDFAQYPDGRYSQPVEEVAA